MKDEKIIETCELYKEAIDGFFHNSYLPETYKHIGYMLWRIPEFVRAGRKEKEVIFAPSRLCVNLSLKQPRPIEPCIFNERGLTTEARILGITA